MTNDLFCFPVRIYALYRDPFQGNLIGIPFPKNYGTIGFNFEPVKRGNKILKEKFDFTKPLISPINLDNKDVVSIHPDIPKVDNPCEWCIITEFGVEFFVIPKEYLSYNFYWS